MLKSSRETKYEIENLGDVIHPVCCGLDIHKTWIYAAILIYNFEKKQIHWITTRVTSFKKKLDKLAKWLIVNGCKYICMESTGQYWIPVFDALEDAGLKPIVAHPKYLKVLSGKKSDPNDARWIAKAFACGRVVASFIPPKVIRNLRSLVRFMIKISHEATSNKNRARNCLTSLGLKLDDVFSDVFGKSSRSIINYIIAHPGEKFDVAPFVDKACKTPIAMIQDSIDKAIDAKQDAGTLLKLRKALERLDDAEKDIQELKGNITQQMGAYKKQLDLIRTVPGFDTDPFTAMRVLIEIGPDMKVFPTMKHFCSWAGVCPHHDSSAYKVKGRRISRSGTYLKPLLVNIAKAVVRSKNHPEISQRFNRIKNRRGYMKAIIAVCRMFLTAIWNILSKGEPYRADGFMPVNKGNNKAISISQALAYVRSRGYAIIDDNSGALTTTGSQGT